MDWIASDHSLQQATCMFISETWLDENDVNISLPGYKTNLNSVGRGHGTVTFYREQFALQEDVHIDRTNITKLTSPNVDVIGVYRSNEGNIEILVETLKFKPRRLSYYLKKVNNFLLDFFISK